MSGKSKDLQGGNPEIQVSFDFIKITNFTIDEPKRDVYERYDPTKLKFSMRYDHEILEDGRVFTLLHTAYQYSDNEDSDPTVYLSLGLIIIFEVKSGGGKSVELTTEMMIADGILTKLANISITYSSGIIYTRSLGSFWNDKYLPIENAISGKI